jgi:hypothetical protein
MLPLASYLPTLAAVTQDPAVVLRVQQVWLGEPDPGRGGGKAAMNRRTPKRSRSASRNYSRPNSAHSRASTVPVNMQPKV